MKIQQYLLVLLEVLYPFCMKITAKQMKRNESKEI